MKKVLLLILAASIVWSASAFAEESAVVAKIGDKKIKVADLNRIVGYYDPERQAYLKNDPQKMATLLKRMIQTRVISDIAKKNGFDKRPDIKERLELFTGDLLATEYIKSEIISKVNVTEDEMDQYYKAHQDEFRSPEMVRARHILIKVDRTASEDDKKNAREKAEGILKRIKAGEDFAKLANEVSDDTGSKTKGGDLGLFPKGRMVPAFEQAAFSLKPGEVSDVIESPFGFHIIKVEEKKEAGIETYEQAKDKVKEKVLNILAAGRVSEFIEKALKDAKVEINPEPLMPKK